MIVRKKTGKIRLCIDFRKLNELVELDNFNVPKISEIMLSLRDKKYFSIIDLKDGFFQVPLRKEDKEKTTFLDGNNRLMQFKKMPQGFKNSPAVFQRGMQIILRDLIGTHCFVYIDDVLIFGCTEEEHDRNLELVVNRLKKYGLKCDNQKSKTKQTEIQFLGYTITKNKVKPVTCRAEGIINFKKPLKKKRCKSF